MKISILFFILLMTIGCVSQRNLSIENNKFNRDRLNKTTLRSLKIKYPFAKREKQFRSILWRTDEGRVCETVYNESLTLKNKGVKLTFLYSANDKKKERSITSITYFKRPYHLNNGIEINKSRLSVVDSLYKDVNTNKVYNGIEKEVNDISFFSYFADNKDSIEVNMIINKIEIK